MKNSSEPKHHKILIANRGEIAIRIMQACRKLGHAFVALFTEPDRHSEHCVLARKLGGEDSLYRVSSYLDANEIFVILPSRMHDALQDAGAQYHPWPSDRPGERAFRLVTAFDTDADDVDKFLSIAKAA